jgi:uncharacterized protein (TIGR02001 family)
MSTTFSKCPERFPVVSPPHGARIAPIHRQTFEQGTRNMHANTKKPLFRPVTTGILLMSALALANAAQAELEFNVGVFSDYLDDGASGSNNNAVVQGGVDYSHDSGFYLGTWLSTLGDGDGQEVDLYAGYQFSAGTLDFDVGYVYYYYPSLDQEDAGEIYGYVTYGPAYFGIDYTVHADDNGGDSGDITYRIGAEQEVMPTISLNGELGYADPDAGGEDSVTFWALGLTKSTDLGDFSLTYGSTDEDDSQDLFVVGYHMSF